MLKMVPGFARCIDQDTCHFVCVLFKSNSDQNEDKANGGIYLHLIL